MELNLQRKTVACYHKVYSGTLRKETEHEAVVPDTMPDISEIISTEGTLLIRSKEIRDGSIHVDASMPVSVIYCPDGERGLCVLRFTVPVSFHCDCEGVTQDCKCSVRLSLKSLESRMVNPRKVCASALAEAQLLCYAAGEELSLSPAAETPVGIHLLPRETEIGAVCCLTEKTFILTDEFILEPEAAPIHEILSQSIEFRTEELRPAGNKMIVKGTAHSRILYCSADFLTAEAEFQTPFSQMIDTDCDTENAFAQPEYLISGLYFDVSPSYDNRSVKLEAHVALQLRLCRNTALEYIADAYSNSYAVKTDKTQRAAERIGRELFLQQPMKNKLDVPEQLVGVLACRMEIDGAECSGEAVSLSVTAHIYGLDGSGTLCVLRKNFPLTVSAQLAPEERLSVCGMKLNEQSASLTGDGLLLSCTAELNCLVCSAAQIESITAISYEEPEPGERELKPSLVILRASSRDDLWTIAKENSSSVEAIVEANGPEALTGEWEKLLLIPRAE